VKLKRVRKGKPLAGRMPAGEANVFSVCSTVVSFVGSFFGNVVDRAFADKVSDKVSDKDGTRRWRR